MSAHSADAPADRQQYRIPQEIAETILLSRGYRDEEGLNAAFAWLRANQPLGIAELEGYDPVWVVTKHRDVLEIEKKQDLFHSIDFATILNTRAGDQFLRDSNNGSIRAIFALPQMDPPEHAIYRKIAADFFTPQNIVKLGEQIRAIARAAVAKLVSGPSQVDFAKDFALHYPLRVIMTMFGVPPEDEPKMLRLTQDLFGNDDPEERRSDVTELTPDQAARQTQATYNEFFAYFGGFTQDRRANPRDDLMSILANAKINGEYMTDFQVNGYYVTIATAGHDTTSSSTSAGMQCLAQNPDQLAKVKANPALIPSLVDESIRWATPIHHFMRSVTADTELRGRVLRANDRLMLCYPSANRDEEVFADANRFNVERRPNKHVAFGYGPHVCLGQHLAKLEMRILFEELLPHIDAVELAGPVRFVESNFVGGIKSLPVKFTFRAVS